MTGVKPLLKCWALHCFALLFINFSSFPIFSGVYCSGWVKRGPVGVIVTTMNDSFETAESVMEDVQSGILDVSASKGGFKAIEALLKQRGM